jgi:outer membrane protein OmpA-like peptidoglycan-associated protein
VPVCGLGRPAAALALAALVLCLAGCSDVPDPVNPVSWWHGLEGGEIAKYRPPPPNPSAPFPKIAAQPTRPKGMPDWEWNQLSARLAAQRAAAQTYAAQNPIPTLPNAPAVTPNAAPVLAPVPAAPPPAAAAQTTAASAQSSATAAELARLQAAPGPAGSQPQQLPAGAVATATANAGNTSTSALTFNGPSTQAQGNGPQTVPIPGSPNPGGPGAGTKISYFDANNGLSIPGALNPVEQPDEANPPPVPTTVPLPPAVAGFAIPTLPATYVPPKPVPEPVPYVPPAPLPDAPPVPVQFPPRSAVLSPPMQQALRNLVVASKGAHISVTGFGDAAGDAIPDQAQAMPLALERARAILVQLMTFGVSTKRVTTQARALGSGGLARLVD